MESFLHVFRITGIHIDHLIKRLMAAIECHRKSSPRILAPVSTHFGCRREVRSLVYRMLAGNLVGYFLSVTIVSIFLGLGLLSKSYNLITISDLLKPFAFSYERILPLFSQIIFGLLAISLLLIGSLFIYSIVQRYLINSHNKFRSKVFWLSTILVSGYLLLDLGHIFRDIWHKPLLYITLHIMKLFTFMFEKLSGFSYDMSLGLLILIISAFFLILRKLFSQPPAQQSHGSDTSIAGLIPVLISIIQVISVVSMILMVNIFVLGILLVITIKKTLLFYYLILLLGLGMAYLMQEIFILRNWQRPLSLGMKFALVGIYAFICLVLEGTTIKLLQLFS